MRGMLQYYTLDNPVQEIGRLQKEIEGYLQQVQVIEQRAMRGMLQYYTLLHGLTKIQLSRVVHAQGRNPCK